jgi:hypothetical protein
VGEGDIRRRTKASERDEAADEGDIVAKRGRRVSGRDTNDENSASDGADDTRAHLGK